MRFSEIEWLMWLAVSSFLNKVIKGFPEEGSGNLKVRKEKKLRVSDVY